MGTGSFPGVKSGRGVTLTPHPLLVRWSRESRAIPLLRLWAVRPVQSLCACTRVHFTFLILLLWSICFLRFSVVTAFRCWRQYRCQLTNSCVYHLTVISGKKFKNYDFRVAYRSWTFISDFLAIFQSRWHIHTARTRTLVRTDIIFTTSAFSLHVFQTMRQDSYVIWHNYDSNAYSFSVQNL